MEARAGLFKIGVGTLNGEMCGGGGELEGVVVGFPKTIANVSHTRIYDGADISTQWACVLKNGKMETITLEVDWIHLNTKVIIPFDVTNAYVRKAVKRICKEKRLFLANSEGDENEGSGGATYVEINKTQALEWIELEESGGSVEHWKDKL